MTNLIAVHRGAMSPILGSFLRLAFAALLLHAVAPRAGAQSADAAIDKATALYAGIRTSRGALEMTVRSPLLGTDLHSRATFQQQIPGLLSVRFSDPQGDMIVADGKFVWLYLPSSQPGYVTRFPIDQGGGSVDLVQLFTASPRVRYTISDSGTVRLDNRTTRHLLLVPRQPMAEFTRAQVWIDEADGSIRQFEIVEHSGVIRRIRLTELQLNAPVTASQFTFTVPRGVRIVEGGG